MILEVFSKANLSLLAMALTSLISVPGEAYSLRRQNVPSVTRHDVYPPGVRFVRGEEKSSEGGCVEVQVTRRLRPRLDSEWRNKLKVDYAYDWSN